MSYPSPSSGQSERIRLHPTPNNASAAARKSIIESSAKGWSPLQINKRDGLTSPIRQSHDSSPNPSHGNSASPSHLNAAVSPRRTSSSFKHVTKNSLVSNSPFKSPTTVQGQQAAGIWVEPTKADNIIHERKAARSLGESPEKALGAASTPKMAIGLGITASAPRPRSASRTPSSGNSSGSALNGTRRVSTERKVVIPSSSVERRVSGSERKPSGSKENDSPDARSGKRSGKSPSGLGKLAKNEYVSRSPFLSSAKRIPSAEKPNDSPVNYSPKSIPVEKDDVFGSPSPRRTSLSRRRSSPSPIKALATSIRADTSPTSSPSRGLTSTIPLAGPSPLGRPSTIPSDVPTPTITPTRSSMTPSRRLRGPRDLSDISLDSPSKQSKTVTFQAVPDVKEFEIHSVEASADGSFEAGSESGEGSLDSIALDESLIDSPSALRITNPDKSPSPEKSDMSHADYDLGDESTTADFVDALIEEGLLSPPQGQTASFAPSLEAVLDGNPPTLSTPSLGESIHATPLLANISFDQPPPEEASKDVDPAGIPYGQTHHAERAAQAHSTAPSGLPVKQPELPQRSDRQLLLNANAAQPSLYSDPFDTAPISPTRQTAHQLGPMPDPFITIQTATSVLAPAKIENRSEDGIPLGRTSHLERMQAARMLATQSLGLGMPRSPAMTRDLNVNPPKVDLPTPTKPAPAVDAKQAENLVEKTEEDMDAFFDVSFDSARRASEASAPALTEKPVEERLSPTTPKKQWAPQPQNLDLPSPVENPAKAIEEEKAPQAKPVDEKEKEKSRFALPFIGITSPFFSQSARVPSSGSISGSSINSTDEAELDDRPLTPPPNIAATSSKKPDSPHRIPSFEFEEISLHAVEQPAFRTARIASPVKASQSTETKTTSTSVYGRVNSPISSSLPTSTPASASRVINPTPLSISRPITSTKAPVSPLSARSNGSSGDAQKVGSAPVKDVNGNSESTNTRIRQRISREMVRETINQRLADGSISRRGSTQALVGVSAHYADLAPTPPRPTSIAFPIRAQNIEPSSSFAGNRDKVLPPPPGQRGVAMTKAHTTDTNQRKVSGVTFDLPSDGSRPKPRPRSQTQSAHEVLKANERDGIISEPKSALDRIIGEKAAENLNASTTSNASTAILKPVVPSTPTKRVSFPAQPRRSETLEVAETANSKSTSETAGTTSASHRKEKNRAVSGSSMVSTGSRKSRRSMSMSDAPETGAVKNARKNRGNPRLTLGIDEDEVSILESFREEAKNIGSDRGYRVKERPTVKASYGPIGHGVSGDVHGGKAWRSLRRPSDMNEHANQLREIRTKEVNSGRASGTIFVKVLGVEQLDVPVPNDPTYFCITLDNGIDYIRTPYSRLSDGARVDQEFSLVEQRDFEFSLSLDIRNDPHILKAIHEKRNPAPTPAGAPSLAPSAAAQKASGGLRGLFGSPRKPKRPESMIQSRSVTPQSILIKPSNGPSIVDYFASDASSPSGSNSTRKASTIAKTHVCFKPIAKQCEGKVLEIRYPMFAMFKGDIPQARPNSNLGASTSTAEQEKRKPIAKITLQIFRLAPLPGLQQDQLPNCLDEALRGIRHHAWWECEYHEGVLTQLGGDCKNPRRRLFKVIGGNLVAINEVTKKKVASIDLRKAIGITDLNADTDDVPLGQMGQNGTNDSNGKKRAGSPVSRMTVRLRDEDEFVEIRPRSFRLDFEDGEGEFIDFWADKQEDKDVWLATLRGLIGRIPSNPLWAELLSRQQREEEERRKSLKKTASSQSLKKQARASQVLSPTRRAQQ